MNQKTICITGGSRGIGFAIASKFHQEGFQVIITGKSPENLNSAKEKLPGLVTFSADMEDKTQVKALATKILKEHGPPDILVNNAGQFIPGLLLEEEDETFEKIMNINLRSVYYLTKSLLPAMIERKEGTVFNMCSVASIMPYDNGGTYCMSKYALLAYTKVLRREMMEKNIRVIAVLPGAVYTDSWKGSGIPPERMMPPEDIAEAVWSSWNMSGRTVVEEIVLRPLLGDV